DTSLAERTVGLDLERHPHSLLGIGIGHVERLLIRRKGDAVGPGHVLGQQRQFAVLAQAVDATEIQLARGIVPVLLQAVGRIGEVEIAVGLEDAVVGAVEALALVAVGQRGLLAVLFQAGDAAVAVLTEDQPALGIEQQAVGAGFAAARLGAGVA